MTAKACTMTQYIRFATGTISVLLLSASLLLVTGTGISAQENASGEKIPFSYTYTVFGADSDFLVSDNEATVEFSYTFPAGALGYSNDGVGVLIVEMRVADSAGESVGFGIWTSRVDWKEEYGDTNRPVSILSIERLQLPSGVHRADMKIYDVSAPDRADSATFTINVPSFRRTKPAMSEIDLITRLVPASSASGRERFRRGEYIIVRDVEGIIDPPEENFIGYLELYNLDRLQQRSMQVSWIVADTGGRGIARVDTIYTIERGDSMMFVTQSFDMSGAPSGPYIIAARMYDGTRMTATDSSSVYRRFFVWNPRHDRVVAGAEERWEDTRVIAPEYAGLTEEELDEQLQMASYIMTNVQMALWENLEGVTAKGAFLTRFWLSLDDDPSTPENRVRERYYARARKAGQYYRSGLTPKGWDSPRGRILLKFGEPDQIERHPNDFNRKPFEIWRYAASRQIFVFVDIGQTGVYNLVHSTAPSEVRNENWERDHAQMHDDPQERSSVDRNTSIFRD